MGGWEPSSVVPVHVVISRWDGWLLVVLGWKRWIDLDMEDTLEPWHYPCWNHPAMDILPWEWVRRGDRRDLLHCLFHRHLISHFHSPSLSPEHFQSPYSVVVFCVCFGLMSSLSMFIPRCNLTHQLASRDSWKSLSCRSSPMPSIPPCLSLLVRHLDGMWGGPRQKRICLACQCESEGPMWLFAFIETWHQLLLLICFQKKKGWSTPRRRDAQWGLLGTSM